MPKNRFDKKPGRPAQKVIQHLTDNKDHPDSILVITRMGQWKCFKHSDISPLTAGYVIGALGLKEIPGSSHSKELNGEWIFVLPHNLHLYKNNKT